ncbi:MAG: hypothetical protein Q7T05_06585 [Dehalococcoidia bacterium]|nr:hypothetical protein [Dehalococcoidia bacterium]
MNAKRMVGILLALVMVLGMSLPAFAQGPIEPPLVHQEMKPGDSITVTKTVTTPVIPPNPDIYFLADTTGSMGGAIANVKANAGAIMAAVMLAQPTAQFGVGNYKDFPYDSYAFQNQQNITGNTADVQTAINAWAAGGGADGPEGWMYAMDRIANVGVGWRANSTKIVVQFGDAPGHDPVPKVATGLGYDITEATATAALVAADIHVIAVSLPTGGYANGLNDNPLLFGGNYASAYGIVEGGLPGQAGRIAAATNGAYLLAPTAADVAVKILEGLHNLKTDVWGTVVADPGLSVTLVPPVHFGVASGTPVNFIETITITGTKCLKYYATVTFWGNTHPKEGAVIGTEKIEVGDFTPPKVWSVESVNPNGNNIPPAGSGTLPGPKGGMNEDGFYQELATDNCDKNPQIYISYVGSSNPKLFGPFDSGIVVKFTQAAPGRPATIQKIGSTTGKAGAVAWHIILPADASVIAIDEAGNVSKPYVQLVPRPPK